MSQAFDELDKMDIIDKLNNIGNNFSISTDGLATALQNSASSLKTAGNTLDESIALVTAGNAVVQDPSKVGNAFRTVALRITGTKEAKQELADLGEDVDDFVVQTTAKSQQIIKDYTAVASNAFKGVDILDENGNFRSTYQILQDIADVYDEIVETDKQYGTNRSQGLLEALAGKTRANVIASVLQNGDMLREVYQSSQLSQGSAEEELAKYQASISGHIAQLQNQWQQAWANTANRDTINFFIDTGTAIMELVNKVGLLKTAIPTIGAFYALILSRGAEGKSTLKSLGDALGKLWEKMRVPKQTAEAIPKVVGRVSESLDDMIDAADGLDTFSDTLTSVGQAGEAAGKGLLAGFTTFGKVVLGIGVAVAAIAAFYAGYQYWYKNYSDNFDALSARVDDNIKSSQEHINALQSEATEYENSASSLQELLNKYREAEVGSEEYYNIRQQIAEQYPELVVAWDNEGNAILQSNEKIQQAIDKYHELATAKQEAAKEAAGLEIDILATSVPDLKESRDKLVSDLQEQNDQDYKLLKQLQEKQLSGEEVTEYLGFQDVPIDNVIKVVTQNIKDRVDKIKEANAKVDAAVAGYKNLYAQITPNLGLEKQEVVDTVDNLQILGSELGLTKDQYLQIVDVIRKEHGKGTLSDALNELINPDYSKIGANEVDYLNLVKDSIETIQTELEKYGIDRSISDKIFAPRLKEAKEMQKYYNEFLTDIAGNEEYQQRAEKLGIDWLNIFKDKNLTESLQFDPDQFLNDKSLDYIQDKYGDCLDSLKETTEDFWNEYGGELDFENLLGIDDESASEFEIAARNFLQGALDLDLIDSSNLKQGFIQLMQEMGILASEMTPPKSSWDTFVDETKESINTIGNASSTLSSAMQEQNKYGFITQKTFEGLTDAYDGFANAVTVGAHGMQLNTEAAQGMMKTMKQDASAKLAKEHDRLTKSFAENTEQINEWQKKYQEASGQDKIDAGIELTALSKQRQELESQLKKWQELNGYVESSKSLYAEWLESQGIGSDADMYDTIRGGKDAIKEKIDNGRWNDNEVKAWMKLVTGQEMNGDKVYDQYENAFDFVKKYMTDDESGSEKFIKLAKDALHNAGMENRFNEEGGLKRLDDQTLAAVISDYMQNVLGKEGFSISDEMVTALLDAARVYDLMGESGKDITPEILKDNIDAMQAKLDSGEIEEGSELWQIYSAAIEDAKQKLIDLINLQAGYRSPDELTELTETANKGLSEDKKITFDTDYQSPEEATLAIEKLTAARDSLLDGSTGEIIDPANQESLEALNTLIQNAQFQLGQLTGENYTIHINTDQQITSPEEQQFVDKASEVEQKVNVIAKAEVKNPEEISEAIGELKELKELDVDGEFSAKYEIDIDGAIASLEALAGQGTTTAEQVDDIDDVSTSNAQGEMDELTAATNRVRVAAISAKSALTNINNFYVNGDLGFGALQSTIRSARAAAVSLLSVLNQMDGKTVTVHYKHDGDPGPGGTGGYRGTAHLPTMSLWTGNAGLALAHGTIGAKYSDPNTLVGELGPELRIRGNKWDLLGEHGAEFRNDVKAGDIIFNHKQTEELFANGRINSRGHAYVGGNADLDKIKELLQQQSKATIIVNGDIVDPVRYDEEKKKKKKKDTPDTTKKKTTSSSSTTKGSKGGKGDKDEESKKPIDKFKEWLEKFFDWIEIKLSRVEDMIDHLVSAAESFADRMEYAMAQTKYMEAIEKTMEQMKYQSQAADKYAEMAEKVMDEAVKKKLIKSDDSAGIMEKIKNGTIDISEYDEEMQEVIKSVQDWVEKSYEAKNAIAELQEQVRGYVKSLKELHDAQRDAALDKSNNFITIAQSGFESTSDFRASYSKGRAKAEIKQLQKQNKIYSKATKQSKEDLDTLTSEGKAEISTEYKKAKKAKNDKYKKALQTAKSCMNKQQPIPESVLLTINENSPTTYARLLAYNEALGNYETAREEEALAIAENIAKINELTASTFEADRQVIENKQELYDKKLDNAVGYKAQNKILDKQISLNKDKLKSYDSEIKKFSDRQAKQASIITSGKNRTTSAFKGLKKSKPKVYAAVTKLIQEIVGYVKKGVAINPEALGQLEQYYVDGYIDASFYEACLSYNDSLEHKREAEAQREIMEQTVKAENSANALQKINNIQEDAENQRTIRDQKRNSKGKLTGRTTTGDAQARLDLAAAEGHYGRKSDYLTQIESENKNLTSLTKERTRMLNELNNAVKKGWIEEGSSDYMEALNAINGVSDAIDDARKNIVELNKSIRQIDWSIFDDGMARAQRLNSEINHYMNMLNNQELFRDTSGNITRYGVAALDLKNTEYKTNLAEASAYLTEYQDLVRQINEKKIDPTDSEVIDRMNSLKDSYWQAMEGAEAAKQSVIDLVRQGYEAQLNALTKTINKYKELKNAEKAAYDYQKQISDKAKNITNLEKQLAAYQGNTSEEAVTKIQKLQSDITKAREDLRDAEYSKYLSDSQAMLDDLTSNFQDWLDVRMKERDDILEDIQSMLAGDLSILGVDTVNRDVKNTAKTLREIDGGLTTALKDALGINGDLDSVITDALAKAEKYYTLQGAQEGATKIESQLSPYRNQNIRKITEDDAEDIQRIYKEYNALGDGQKKQVSNEDKKLISLLNDWVKDLPDVLKLEKSMPVLESTITSYKKSIEKATKQATEARVNGDLTTAKKIQAEIEDKTAIMNNYQKQLNSQLSKYNSYKSKYGFASGSQFVIKDQLAWTQEKGQEVIYRRSDGAMLTPLGRGDKVFTAAMSDNLWKLAQMNIAEMFDKSMTQPTISNNVVNNNMSPNTTVQLSITLPNVTNYDEFKNALIADRKFQNAIQDMTLGAAVGKNSLSKYRYTS